MGAAPEARRRRRAAARRARSPLPAVDGAAHVGYPAGRAGLPALAQGPARAARARARRAARRRGLRRGDDRARAGDRAQGRPRARGRDDDVQVLEDALCLVFLETQLVDIAARLDPGEAAGRDHEDRAQDECRGTAPRSPTCRSARARAGCSTRRSRAMSCSGTSTALAAGDWDALAATLAPDVERIGPYRDVFHGRDAYAEFLRTTITSLVGLRARRRRHDRRRQPGRGRAERDRRRRRRPAAHRRDGRVRRRATASSRGSPCTCRRRSVDSRPSERARMTEPVCDARSRTHAPRPHREARRGDGRGGRRHARAVRAAERVVRDRRAGARGRSRARVVVARGRGARAGRAVAAPLHRLSRRCARRRCPTSSCTARSRSRPRRARRSSSRSSAAGGWRSTTRRSRCGRRCATRDVVDASAVIGPAKLTKTPDELECIRRAQAINEAAMRVVRPLAVPGALRDRALGRVPPRGRRARRDREHRRSRVPGDAAVGRGRPFSITGEPVFPIPTRADELQRGDVMWIDTGINLHGYASDFGATWIVGREPERPSSATSSTRWRAVVDRALARVKPGATAADLVEAAQARRRPAPVALVLLPRARDRHRQRGDAVRRHRPRRRVRRVAHAAAGHGARVRTGGLGRRARRPPLEEIVAVTDDGYVRLSEPGRARRSRVTA